MLEGACMRPTIVVAEGERVAEGDRGGVAARGERGGDAPGTGLVLLDVEGDTVVDAAADTDEEEGRR